MEEIAAYGDVPVITPEGHLNLEFMDPELVLVMLQYLSIQDIQNFCNTTTQHRGICQSSAFQMVLQPKIEERYEEWLEMEYQELVEMCRKYPILQGFCENDDAFWDTKFRLDFAGEIEEVVEEGLADIYLPSGKSIRNDLLNKQAYEEFLTRDNEYLLHIGDTDNLAGNLRLGRYLRRDLSRYIAAAKENINLPEYQRFIDFALEVNYPVDDATMREYRRVKAMGY